MFRPACLPILIGSLPIEDHREATRIILKHTPVIPLWPQLPKHPKEGMVRQFLTGFPGLVEEGDRYWIDTGRSGFSEEMVAFYEEYMQVEEDDSLLGDSRFKLGRDTALGFFTLMNELEQTPHLPLTIKGQVTGPMTAGIGVADQNGRSIFYDDNLRDILIKLLTMKARWQVREMKRFTEKIPPIIFIDEPGIVSFGSSAFPAISGEMVVDGVAEVISGVKAAGGLAGVHICANGDWSLVLSSNADIISFDAYSYFEHITLFKKELTNYLQRGGILAWGIVPTGDPLVVAEESTDSLFRKWQGQLEVLTSFGFSEKQLMEQTLIAPACGTGSLHPELAKKVLAMTSALSEKIRPQLKVPKAPE